LKNIDFDQMVSAEKQFEWVIDGQLCPKPKSGISGFEMPHALFKNSN